MAAITPKNGRVNFVSDHDPHTYWELNTTNLGTNYGDDTSGNDDNTNVTSTDITTSDSYQGMNAQNDPPASGWFDIYTVTDAAALVYIPSGLTHDTVYGLFHNGGGTNAQGAFLRATTTGVEIACATNAGGDTGDYLIEEIPDADLPGWFCLGFQFSSEGGSQGDMGLWVNGTKERSGTRSLQLAYGSGDPDFGNNAGREPNAAEVLDPSSYSGGDWGGNTAIDSSGILIANFTCDNPGPTNTTPAGNGDTWYEDYYDEHVETTVNESGTVSRIDNTSTMYAPDGSYTAEASGSLSRQDTIHTLYDPQATISRTGSVSVISGETQTFDPTGSAAGSAIGSVSTVDSENTLYSPTGSISVSGSVSTVTTEYAVNSLQVAVSVNGLLPRIDLTTEPLPVRGGALEAPVTLQEIIVSLFDPTARISVTGNTTPQNIETTLYDTTGRATMLGAVSTIDLGYEMGIARRPPSGFVPWVQGAAEAGLSQVGSAKTTGEPGIAASVENKPKVSSSEDSSTLVPGIKDAVHPY